MRRNSLLILLSMIALLIVIAVLLIYVVTRSPVSDTVVPSTAESVSPEQQLALSSEPVGMPMRSVYIVSVLVVFVSAVLILFRMLLGIPGKNEE
ncbi:MAG: hypothetical protein JXR84_28370 [Anaerolineae bacterium]|nr:hypothetical protein [Anaerolineae bacterium]